MGLAELIYQDWEKEEDEWVRYGALGVSGLGSQERDGGGSGPEIWMVGWEGSVSFCLPGEQSGLIPKGNRRTPLYGLRQEDIVQKPVSEVSSSNRGLDKLQRRETRSRKISQ